MAYIGEKVISNQIDTLFITYDTQVLTLYLFFTLWGTSEGYCWTRTGERQASRMRARYLKAVLRQEVAYFDLHVTSTSEFRSHHKCL
jgi:ABC-type multidrug transport system fused ATPase/permease subunit